MKATVGQFALLCLAFTALAIESPLVAIAAACLAVVAVIELRSS